MMNKDAINITRADENDIDGILSLLSQVLEIHAKIRPDLFISGTTKYTKAELVKMITDDSAPIFVARDKDQKVLGYAFCLLQEESGVNLVPHKCLYIDDLCVDSSIRGLGIGRMLYDHVKDVAKALGCYDITLNVWEGNDSARHFYGSMGMGVKKTMMEEIL